jgi:hypothetical protein
MDLLILGQYAAALIAILSLGGMLVKWGIVKPIKAYIDQATYPIHPNSNGGKSLPDLINTVDEIKTLVNSHLQDHKK